MAPKVSIIVPIYNVEKYLPRCLDSLVRQTLYDIEIIAVNDGSTDGSLEILRDYGKRDFRIKISNQENYGVSEARNKGISIATGEYILFFDADDTAKENGFSECVEIIGNEKPDILIFGMSFDYYKNGKLYRRDKMVPEQNGMLNKTQIKAELESLYNTNSLTSSCNKIYKKALVIGNNILFNTNYFLMEDFLFSLECLKVCENIYCFPKALYYYRLSENEKNAFSRLKRIDDLCEYVSPFKTAVNELADDEKGDRVFNNFFFMLLSQKMYYANEREIRKLANEINQDEIPVRYISFLKDIKEARYLKIRLFNLKTQARHRVAVLVKSIIKNIRGQ